MLRCVAVVSFIAFENHYSQYFTGKGKLRLPRIPHQTEKFPYGATTFSFEMKYNCLICLNEISLFVKMSEKKSGVAIYTESYPTN